MAAFFEMQSPSVPSTAAGSLVSRPTVLSVSASEHDHLPLREIAGRFGWKLFESNGCAEALALLRRQPIAIVVCDQYLGDGDWTSLLRGAHDLVWMPGLIVASRLADNRLWSEVLNLGAYDLLQLPFDNEELRRVVSLAWESKCWEAAVRAGAKKPTAGNSCPGSAAKVARAASRI